MATLELISGNISWEQMLRATSSESLLLLCRRLQIEQMWMNSAEEPSVFLENYLREHPETLLILFTRENYKTILQIWENVGQLKVDRFYRQYLMPLEALGLIQYHHKEKELVICEEARSNFYFYLKSRSSRKKIEEYQELEYAVKGMMYQYGIIELTQFYDMIKRGVVSFPCSMDWFYRFLIGRTEFWAFLGVLKNNVSGDYYIISHEVKEKEQIFPIWIQQEAYCKLTFSDAVSLGKMSGIGTWKGTKELMSYCLKTVYDDVMAATVFVKTVLVYIQNGETAEIVFEKLQSKIEMLKPEEKHRIYGYIKDMYRHTPIFCLKGYSRQELTKAKQAFSVIEGGKKD